MTTSRTDPATQEGRAVARQVYFVAAVTFLLLGAAILVVLAAASPGSENSVGRIVLAGAIAAALYLAGCIMLVATRELRGFLVFFVVSAGTGLPLVVIFLLFLIGNRAGVTSAELVAIGAAIVLLGALVMNVALGLGQWKRNNQLHGGVLEFREKKE